MAEETILSGDSTEKIAELLRAEFLSNPNPQQYHAVLTQKDRRVLLNIATDPEEPGFALTTFNAYLYSRNDFRFAIYNQTMLDGVGKFFGMEDVILGYKEFDDHFVVKTSRDEKTSMIFADPAVRATLQSLPALTFGIVQYTLEDADGKVPFLELKIREAITDPRKLSEVYDAFFKVLMIIEA